MSDRYLRTLLRQAQQGQVAITDYVAAALRVSTPEAVIADLQGFDTEAIRLALRLVWIPVYATQSKHAEQQAALAIALVAGETDFPYLSFFERNQSLLSDADWRLFAADCAEHVLPHFEDEYPNDDRPRKAIETARHYARGEATAQELADARSAARSAAWSAEATAAESAADAAAWYAAWQAGSAAYAAAWDAAESAARQAEISWQRQRLSDYLVDLGALPLPR